MEATNKNGNITVINLNDEHNSSVITFMLFNLLREKQDKKVNLINAYFNNSFVKEDADDMTCQIVHFNIPYLNKIKCNYCGRCVTHCSRGLAKLDRTVPSVTFDKNNCQGCLNCARSCTVKAITSQEIEIGRIFKTVIGNSTTILSGAHKAGDHHDLHIFKEMNAKIDKTGRTIYDVPYNIASISRKAITDSEAVFIILPHFKSIDDEMQALLYFIHKQNKKAIYLKKVSTDVTYNMPGFLVVDEMHYYNDNFEQADEKHLNKEFKRILKTIKN